MLRRKGRGRADIVTMLGTSGMPTTCSLRTLPSRERLKWNKRLLALIPRGSGEKKCRAANVGGEGVRRSIDVPRAF